MKDTLLYTLHRGSERLEDIPNRKTTSGVWFLAQCLESEKEGVITEGCIADKILVFKWNYVNCTRSSTKGP